MKTFEYLMVRITNNLKIKINKALSQRKVQRLKYNLGINFVKDPFQSFGLFWNIGCYEILKALNLVLEKVLRQQFKIFVKGRLSCRFEFKHFWFLKDEANSKFDCCKFFSQLHEGNTIVK